MLGQNNLQYEWHPLIDEKYLRENNLKYQRTPNMIIYEFDRSNSIRLDELLDSLKLFKLHAGQALYLMKCILEKYMTLKKQKLEPLFVSNQNIWIVIEQASEKFRVIFSTPLRYKICFTYNSKQGAIQEILTNILQKIPLCQSEGDQQLSERSDRNVYRQNIIVNLKTSIKNQSLEDIQSYLTQLLYDYKYNKEEKLFVDSNEYLPAGHRGRRWFNVQKFFQDCSQQTYNLGHLNVLSQQQQQMKGLFIQKALCDARPQLLEEMSATFLYQDSHISRRINDQQIENKIKQWHYSSQYVDNFIKRFMKNIKQEFKDFYINEQFDTFGLSQKDYNLYIQSIKNVHDGKCQEYLLISGYFNSVYDFDRKIDQQQMLLTEIQIFNTNITPLLKSKYREYSRRQLQQILDKIS